MSQALFPHAPRTAVTTAGAMGVLGLAAAALVGQRPTETSPPLRLTGQLPTQTIESKTIFTAPPSAIIAELSPLPNPNSFPQPSPALLRAMEQPAQQPALAQDYEFLPNTQYYKRLRYFLEKHEDERFVAYDCTASACTVGIGFNLDANGELFKKTLGVDEAFLKSVKQRRTELNQAQVETLFKASIRQAEAVCRRKIKNFDQLSQGRRIALTSLAFNAPALIGPKITKAVVNGQWDKAIHEIQHNSGAVNNGLRNRRADEAKIFQINADGYFRHIDPPNLPYHSGDEHSRAPVRNVDVREVSHKFAWLGAQPSIKLVPGPEAQNMSPVDMSQMLAVRTAKSDVLARLGPLVAGRVSRSA